MAKIIPQKKKYISKIIIQEDSAKLSGKESDLEKIVIDKKKNALESDINSNDIENIIIKNKEERN